MFASTLSRSSLAFSKVSSCGLRLSTSIVRERLPSNLLLQRSKKAIPRRYFSAEHAEGSTRSSSSDWAKLMFEAARAFRWTFVIVPSFLALGERRGELRAVQDDTLPYYYRDPKRRIETEDLLDPPYSLDPEVDVPEETCSDPYAYREVVVGKKVIDAARAIAQEKVEFLLKKEAPFGTNYSDTLRDWLHIRRHLRDSAPQQRSTGWDFMMLDQISQHSHKLSAFPRCCSYHERVFKRKGLRLASDLSVHELSLDNFAVILAHEVAHDMLGHLCDANERAEMTYLLESLYWLLLKPTKYSLVFMAGFIASSTAYALYKTRENELKADDLAATIAERAGFDCAKGFGTWEKFDEIGSDKPYLCSHYHSLMVDFVNSVFFRGSIFIARYERECNKQQQRDAPTNSLDEE